MKPAISQVSTLDASLESDFEDYAAAHCEALEIWLGKLEGYLDAHSRDDFRRLRERTGLATPVASYQGGLLISQGEARLQHWEHFERRLELLADLEIGLLVIAGDLAGPLSQQDLERAALSLGQAAVAAARRGVRLAFEFQGGATFANNLQTAAALVADCGEPNLGLCFDVFQYYVGPSKPDDFGYLTRDNLFHVQLSDLADVPRELATDADRILPGDGDFLLEQILAHFRQIGYQGHVSVELMNPQLWQIPPRQFAEVAITALRKVLGQARMA